MARIASWTSRLNLQTPVLALLLGLIAGSGSAAPSRADGPPDACPAGPGGVCLGDGRFLVEVHWFDEPPGDGAEATAVAPDAAWFRSPSGADLVVQVVDGRVVNGHFWVMAAATGRPSYGLEVRDLSTGQRRSYSDLGAAPGAADLLALPAASGPTDPAPVAGVESGALAHGRGDRVGVRLDVQAAARGTAETLAREWLTDRTAIFRRDGERDPALVVSVLDASDLDGRRWVLSSSPTGEEWDIAVRGESDGDPQLLRHAGTAGEVQLAKKPAGGVKVKVTLDTPRAVKRTIPVAGGSLRATAANGTTFTLTIPANALLSPQEIVLTPIKSVAGLPFKGGLAGGVEIEPAGLRLEAAASLLIAPPQAVPLVQETTFGYRARGAQFFLYPALVTGRPVVLPVLHAGGYGLARGTAAEQAKQLTRQPPRGEDQLSQRLWSGHAKRRRLITAAATAAPGSAVTATDTALLDLYRETYRTLVKPRLDAIAQTCSGRKTYGPSAQNLIAMAVANGIGADMAAEASEVRITMNLGTAACYNEEGVRCLANKDPKAIIPMLVAWRQLRRVDRTSLVDPAKLESCLTFDFQLDTMVDHVDAPVGEQWNTAAVHRIDTKAVVRWRQPFDFGTSEPTPHRYNEARWTAGPQPQKCTITGTGGRDPSDLTVFNMMFLGVNSFDDVPAVPKIEVVYTPGNPRLEVRQICPGPPTSDKTFFLELFAPNYAFGHIQEVQAGYPLQFPRLAFLAEDWIVQQGSLRYAYKQYRSTIGVPPLTVKEFTFLNLIHKP